MRLIGHRRQLLHTSCFPLKQPEAVTLRVVARKMTYLLLRLQSPPPGLSGLLTLSSTWTPTATPYLAMSQKQQIILLGWKSHVCLVWKGTGLTGAGI